MEIETLQTAKPRLAVHVAKRDKSVESFAGDVLTGLSSNPKWLHAKYFYDEIGSKLFEEICDLPEYYLTRAEHSILENYADEISLRPRSDTVLIELGSGSSLKTRLIIEAFLRRQGKLHYLPIDISKSMLVDSAKKLLKRYNKLKITALTADYITALKMLENKYRNRKLILFLGSSVGNFNEEEAETFFNQMRETVTAQDRLLLGMDLRKDKSILEAAYNDSQGVTAKFNLNILKRMNRELDANFDMDTFKHKAFFNEESSRIEMHLESLASQSVTIGKLERVFTFEKGETIHTENSYKYSLDHIKEMARQSNFNIQKSWYDDRKWFSLNLFQPI